MTDWISVVEAAYRLDCDRPAWTDGVLEACAPLLDLGEGLVACHFSRSGQGYTVECVATRGVRGADRAVRRILGFQGARIGAELLFRSGVDFSSVSEAMGARADVGEAVFRGATHGHYADGWGGIAHSGDGRALVVGSALRERRRPDAATSSRWGRAASHLGAGLRLHRALARCRSEALDEAVLDPGGAVRDARGEARAESARDALRSAVQHIDRASTRAGRADADAALESWQALVCGRWSLLDRFDADGKRYWVAHRNDPEIADPRGLSRSEAQAAEFLSVGQSEKQIGYALGLSPSAVSRLICAGVRKLGLRSRAELASLFAGRGAGSERFDMELGGEQLAICARELPQPAELVALSGAEREIAAVVGRGQSDGEIARLRGASARTVANQLGAIYRKLGIHSRTELAARISA